MQLDQIIIYPIKSCAGIELENSLVENRGFPMDRRWMLIESDGMFVSQRNSPQLSLIESKITESQILVNYPGMDQLGINIGSSDRGLIKTTIWDDQVKALSVCSEADNWFTKVLNRRIRLVYMNDVVTRPLVKDRLPKDQSFELSFADGFPYLLTNQASLDDLNQRLVDPVKIDRFRPNLNVSGFEPFEEDKWKLISIGDVKFQVVKPCARCHVTTIDQNTAQSSHEPLKTLARYRKYENQVLFGMNLVALNSGSVSINDPVIIL